MKCPTCGHAIDADMRFCPECGTVCVVPQQTNIEPTVTEPQKPKKSKFSIRPKLLVSIIVLCFYLMMRNYFYLLLITFDLSIWKIIKNSLIFTLLGFKRNIVAFIGMLLVVGLEILIFGIFIPLGIIFPFIFLFSLPMFFGVFAAYPKIKEIMIDPQMQDQ